MEFSIEFDPKADKEYFEAWDWYEEQLTGLGDRFGDSVIRQIELISKAPLLYPSKKAQSRECKIEDFPFLIVYKIYAAKNIIYITSIFHQQKSQEEV